MINSISLQKKKMFRKITTREEITAIQVAHYTQLNKKMEDDCEKLFKGINKDAFIICKSEEFSALILGYFVLDNKPFTSSKDYPYLLCNLKSAGLPDLTVDLQKMPSFHISEWVFDESLRNTVALNRIFNLITQYCDDDPLTMLWSDQPTFIFYPLLNSDKDFGHNSAIAYFTEGFMNL